MGTKIYNKALEQFKAKSYLEAKNIFLSIAKENVDAQYYLGAMYRMGLGVRENQKVAFNWFLKAAKQGHVESQYLVGCAYYGGMLFVNRETEVVKYDFKRIQKKSKEDFSIWQDDLPTDLAGIGIEPNDDEALKWMSKAASQNYADAEVALGDMYYWGIDGVECKQEAIMWYTKAAFRGNSIAARHLADYSESDGKDDKKTIELYTIAFHLGDQRSAYNIAEIYENEFSEIHDFNKVLKWYQISAEKSNNYKAQLKLGNFYQDGRRVEKNLELASYWYKKAIQCFNDTPDEGYVGDVKRKLYLLYKNGYEDNFQKNEVLKLLISASDSGESWARLELEKKYVAGEDIGEIYYTKFRLFEKADAGDKQAQRKYGYKYVVNRSTNQDTKPKIFDWFIKDARQGDSEAKYLLASLYEGNSEGSDRRYWLKKAADHGHSQAQYELSLSYEDDLPIEQIKYLKLSSDSNIYAQIDLGYHYAINKEYIKAYTEYQKAASNMRTIKDSFELVRLNHIKFRFNAANDDAEALALQENVQAQLYMGCLYQYGFEVKRNLDKSLTWYEMAKKQGSNEALIQLEILKKEHICL